MSTDTVKAARRALITEAAAATVFSFAFAGHGLCAVGATTCSTSFATHGVALHRGNHLDVVCGCCHLQRILFDLGGLTLHCCRPLVAVRRRQRPRGCRQLASAPQDDAIKVA